MIIPFFGGENFIQIILYMIFFSKRSTTLVNFIEYLLDLSVIGWVNSRSWHLVELTRVIKFDEWKIFKWVGALFCRWIARQDEKLDARDQNGRIRLQGIPLIQGSFEAEFKSKVIGMTSNQRQLQSNYSWRKSSKQKKVGKEQKFPKR